MKSPATTFIAGAVVLTCIGISFIFSGHYAWHSSPEGIDRPISLAFAFSCAAWSVVAPLLAYLLWKKHKIFSILAILTMIPSSLIVLSNEIGYFALNTVDGRSTRVVEAKKETSKEKLKAQMHSQYLKLLDKKHFNSATKLYEQIENVESTQKSSTEVAPRESFLSGVSGLNIASIDQIILLTKIIFLRIMCDLAPLLVFVAARTSERKQKITEIQEVVRQKSKKDILAVPDMNAIIVQEWLDKQGEKLGSASAYKKFIRDTGSVMTHQKFSRIMRTLVDDDRIERDSTGIKYNLLPSPEHVA